MRIDHDLHVHTSLSACCSDAESTPAKIIERAAENGLKLIGFADHMWDPTRPGASDWYRPQDLAHVQRTRELIPEDTRGVRVLVGCESEYCGDGKVGISPEAAAELDFVLLPMSHLHMKGFVEPPGTDTPQDVAELMVRRFREVVGLGLATGLAHPFLPCGHTEEVDAIIACITDSQFHECFGLAADAGVSIEITIGFFPGCRGVTLEGFHDETFLRVLSLAKGAGCRFHFASDAHRLDGIGDVKKLEPYTLALGINAGDITPVAS